MYAEPQELEEVLSERADDETTAAPLSGTVLEASLE